MVQVYRIAGDLEVRCFASTAAGLPTYDFGVRAIQGLVRISPPVAGAPGVVVTVSYGDDFAAEVRSFAKTISVPK